MSATPPRSPRAIPTALLAVAAALSLAPAPARGGVDISFQVFDQQIFETRILPAYQHYEHGRDPARLKALLRETIARLEQRPVARRFGGSEPPLEEITRSLAMLEGDTRFDEGHLPRLPSATRQQKLDRLVKDYVFPLLIEIWCLQRVDGKVLELDPWRSPIWSRLNAASPWLKDQFEGNTPREERSLELSTCQSTSTLAPWWVERFEAELAKVPPPKGEQAAADLRLLRRMVELVRSNPAFRLVMELC